MMTDRFSEDLERLNVPAERAEMLALIPVCYVAWAEGAPSPRAARRVFRLAKHYAQAPDADLRELVAPWLGAPPRPETVSEACHVLRRLAAAPDEHGVTFDVLTTLPCHAEWVARADGNRVDAPQAVTSLQAGALEQVGEWLTVDAGEPWAVVIRELAPSSAAA
ncbi:MAG: hypothetical protein RIF41_24520 [Polyangiaceae bacterium]